MFAHTLIAGLVLAAPPEAAGPRLEKGLEVRWAGTFTEASFRPGVRTVRTYDVDTRLLVLDTGDHGADAVLFTRVFLNSDHKGPPSGVVRLELVRIDPRGKLSVLSSPADHDNPSPKPRPWPLVRLEGLPSPQGGMFVEFPDKPLKVGLAWSREEAGRPIVSWTVADADSFRGQAAVKLIAEQKTTGYYGDRVRQAEWRRQDKLTVLPGTGFASRLERIVERREPEADDLAFRSVLTLEQQGRVVYSGRLFDERKEEAVHAAAFTAQLDRLLAAGGRDGGKPFDALVRQIDRYQSENGSSDTVPFREAIVFIRKRAESAAKGNLPPAPPRDDTAPEALLAVGKPLPDVTAPLVTADGSITVSRLKGKPVVLAYFQPSAPSATGVLKLAQSLQAERRAGILPLAIGDAADTKALHKELRLTIPVFDGTGVYKAHGLDATPVFVVVDADGNVRHVIRGWDEDTPRQVTDELGKLGRKKD